MSGGDRQGTVHCVGSLISSSNPDLKPRPHNRFAHGPTDLQNYQVRRDRTTAWVNLTTWLCHPGDPLSSFVGVGGMERLGDWGITPVGGTLLVRRTSLARLRPGASIVIQYIISSIRDKTFQNQNFHYSSSGRPCMIR